MTVTGVIDDESLEVGRRNAGRDPDLEYVADRLIDVLDASSAVTADSQRFDLHVVVARRRQAAVLHQSVLPARLAVGPRRGGGGWRRRATAAVVTPLDGEVVEGEVDGLTG